jgi:hypothetical protein
LTVRELLLSEISISLPRFKCLLPTSNLSLEALPAQPEQSGERFEAIGIDVAPVFLRESKGPLAHLRTRHYVIVDDL